MDYVKADFMIADSGEKIKPRRKLPFQPAQKGARALLLRRVDDLFGRALLHDAATVHEYMRANCISCVTITIVIFSSASERITRSTSPVSSGSSALVGSSKNSSSGFMQSARAIAARCCCPPESWQG